MQTDPGILIAVEGIDGAGKTTQVGHLYDFFQAVGEPVLRSKEPTDGVWGQKIRRSAAEGRMSLQDELSAFVEDRKEHVRDVIQPALLAGKTIILDRYFYSTVAYQGSRGGDVDALLAWMLETAPEPDVVLLLDVAPEVSLARITEERGTPNAFETIANLKAVRSVFLRLAEQRANMRVLDASANPRIVRREILKLLVDGVLSKRHFARRWGCVDPLECIGQKSRSCRWVQMANACGD